MTITYTCQCLCPSHIALVSEIKREAETYARQCITWLTVASQKSASFLVPPMDGLCGASVLSTVRQGGMGRGIHLPGF